MAGRQETAKTLEKSNKKSSKFDQKRCLKKGGISCCMLGRFWCDLDSILHQKRGKRMKGKFIKKMMNFLEPFFEVENGKRCPNCKLFAATPW
jgi:hypothetical protein